MRLVWLEIYVPPMHIIAGKRFKYNFMKNHADTMSILVDWQMDGLILSLFGWIADHFARKVSVQPVLLLVDGHSSCIDLHISQTSAEIMATTCIVYLPTHHMPGKPLDVSFFKPLKLAWSKVCNDYCSPNPGKVVKKYMYVFAELNLQTSLDQ